jgi:hypothetical protein
MKENEAVHEMDDESMEKKEVVHEFGKQVLKRVA